MNFIEACRKVISLDSTPASSTLEVAQFLGGWAKTLGFEVEYHEESIKGVRQVNVIFRSPNSPPGDELLLQTHIDTVKPGNFGMWTRTERNPFNASIYNDEIVGLGSASCKLDIMCKLNAAKDFLDKDLKQAFCVVGTFGEESGMTGAIRLIRRKKVQAKWALVGEPTDLKLGAAGPGLVVLDVVVPFSEDEKKYHQNHDLMESSTTQSKIFRGQASQAGSSGEGKNAIVEMLNYLKDLPRGIVVMDMDGGVSHNTVPDSCFLEFDMVGSISDTIIEKLLKVYEEIQQLERAFRRIKIPGFNPEHPTMNVGRARKFRDYVQLTGSCRLLPTGTGTDYEVWLDHLRQACADAGATFTMTDLKSPFSTNEESFIAKTCGQALEDSGLEKAFHKIPSCTEASVFGRLGVECLVFGPGKSSGNSHAPNESVKITDLNKAQDFYKKVIERVCL